MKTTIKYHWTGEYDLPEHGEWYLDYNGSAKRMDKTMTTAEPDRPCFILRREEVEEDESSKED